MLNTIVQVNKLHHQEILRVIEQNRLAEIATAAHHFQEATSTVSIASILNEMGHGLGLIGLWDTEPREHRQRAYH